MRTKILGSVLVVLTVLGGMQLFQNMTTSNHYGDSDVDVVRTEIKDIRGIVAKVRLKLDGVDAIHEQEGEVMIEKSFTVKAGSNLVVDIVHSDVEIVTGSGTEASVVVTLKSSNLERGRTRFEEMEWNVYQEGEALLVKAKSPGNSWSFNGNWSIDVLITVPSTFNVDLKTSHGDVNLADINGQVNMQTSHGDVDFGGIEGDHISIKSSHGDISGSSLSSPRVEVETSHADIQIGKVDAKIFNATTSHADISIDNVVGAAEISTSHGDIRVFLAGNEEARLATEHGDIDISINEDMGADLDFKAPEINVAKGVKVNGEKREKSVSGSINGGGARIYARTTHGSIDMNNR
ncbi:MAG: DUF4097 family beta strand repeat-containing protein [Bacteroidetes bacterium]|nr:DUF4097 family beta strand repeat-containing protein [Bacteroidota bacterium]